VLAPPLPRARVSLVSCAQPRFSPPEALDHWWPRGRLVLAVGKSVSEWMHGWMDG